ncbi:hypothetical protein RIF29_38908 [Crotalaria pallida]|uniref:Uncharacterized protein n=1 Tax=Crotalaria pallida TaxID=3830 RepID=A0AAN9E5L8_CROPI
MWPSNTEYCLIAENFCFTCSILSFSEANILPVLTEDRNKQLLQLLNCGLKLEFRYIPIFDSIIGAITVASLRATTSYCLYIYWGVAPCVKMGYHSCSC